MKIELDYDNKTITVKDTVNAKDLINKLSDLKIDLKEWSLTQELKTAEPLNPWQQPFQVYPHYQDQFIAYPGASSNDTVFTINAPNF